MWKPQQLNNLNVTFNLQRSIWNCRVDRSNYIMGISNNTLYENQKRASVLNTSTGQVKGQTTFLKDYNICICCFSAKHTALRRKSEDWLAQNQHNVSEWSDMSICVMLFRWASTIKIQLSVLVEYKAKLVIIPLKIKMI